MHNASVYHLKPGFIFDKRNSSYICTRQRWFGWLWKLERNDFFKFIIWFVYIGQILRWIQLYQKWQRLVQNGWFKRSQPAVLNRRQPFSNQSFPLLHALVCHMIWAKRLVEIIQPIFWASRFWTNHFRCNMHWSMIRVVKNDWLKQFHPPRPLLHIHVLVCGTIVAKVHETNHWFHQLHMGKFDNIREYPTSLGFKYILLLFIL